MGVQRPHNFAMGACTSPEASSDCMGAYMLSVASQIKKRQKLV